MTKHSIRLPNGRSVGLGKYVAAWRKLRKMNPDDQVRGFGYFPEDAAYILREMRFGMHDRINRHIACYGVGRKWDQDWQQHAMQAAHAVNTPRLVVRWVPPDLRKRLAHRITTE